MQPVNNRQIAVGVAAFAALMVGMSAAVWLVGAMLALALE
jgi:hypothetical protein